MSAKVLEKQECMRVCVCACARGHICVYVPLLMNPLCGLRRLTIEGMNEYSLASLLFHKPKQLLALSDAHAGVI